MRRITGVAGIAAAVLLFGGQGFIQVCGGEPPFNAPAADISTFFANRDPVLFPIGSYLSLLGLLAFLWFLGGVYVLLRAGEAEPWLSTVALICGVAGVAGGLTDAWQIAAFRAPEGLDPQLARFAFDLSNMWFASAWVMFGGFALASGWTILSARSMPRWLGWWAIAAGVGLIAARAVWTQPLWFLPYAVFWLWALTLSVRCLRASPVRARRLDRDHVPLVQ